MTGKQIGSKSDRALDELCIEPGFTHIKVGDCERSWCWHHSRCYNNGSPEREIERAGRLADVLGANI